MESKHARYERERRLAFNERVRALKVEWGCVDCGYREHAAALDFDHRPGCVKLFDIGKAANRSWSSVLLELGKCDVVCANCHRVRTFDRRSQM